MQKFVLFYLALFLLVSSCLALAATPFTPTTTLAAETGNNTSAAAAFTGQPNGNIAGANISKVPMRSLLYTGSTAKIYAHFVPWFGFGDHVSVGYTSNDVAQVQAQVADMTSRGFDGVVIDWYGRGTLNHNFVFYDQATQDMMHEAEAHPGFTFAVMEDVGALKQCSSTPGCNVTQTMIDDLNYANTTYWNSPAYLRFNGRPVVYFFGEEAYTIDWNLARSQVAGNPVFVFRNAGGFSYAQAGGGYSWVEPTTTGLTYLDGFYTAAKTFPADYVTGSAYKGFNDSIAAWTAHRLTAQNCGQTWLTSVAEAGKYYSASNQLFGIQLVTWNDYEEGTEIETGIDNCVAVNASVSGTVVSWSITGQMNTVDHFSIYVSQDGQNLMWLADQATTVTSLDLAQFGVPSGNYTVFVKATGKPSLTNKMSNGAQVTLAGGPSTPPVTASFAITAPSGSTATIKAGQTANYSLQLAATGAPASVTVTCADAAPKSACTAPGTALSVTPGTPVNVPVSVTTTANAAVLPGPSGKLGPPAGWLPVASLATVLLFFFGGKQHLQAAGRLLASWSPMAAKYRHAFGFRFSERRYSPRKYALAAPLVLLAGLAVMAGCGGAATKTPNAPTPPYNGTPINSYTLTVTATSGGVTQSQQLTLTVQ
ncbi:MAG TPA: hypothetical protein VI488_03510 [Candidatus Angelobacter sp.]